MTKNTFQTFKRSLLALAVGLIGLALDVLWL